MTTGAAYHSGTLSEFNINDDIRTLRRSDILELINSCYESDTRTCRIGTPRVDPIWKSILEGMLPNPINITSSILRSRPGGPSVVFVKSEDPIDLGDYEAISVSIEETKAEALCLCDLLPAALMGIAALGYAPTMVADMIILAYDRAKNPRDFSITSSLIIALKKSCRLVMPVPQVSPGIPNPQIYREVLYAKMRQNKNRN
jgi:hypothetical protein